MGKDLQIEDFGEIEIDDNQTPEEIPTTKAHENKLQKSKSSSESAQPGSSDSTDSSSSTQDSKKSKKSKKSKRPWSRRKKLIVALIILLLVIGAIVLVFVLAQSSSESSYETEQVEVKYYSALTGEELASADLISSPAYCVQIPNGTDGARPQVGLNQAGIVFEAIAEAGITRFAAIYQNTDDSVIGPIRSLRSYYLEWDTPFNCTVVHAGGSDEALADLKTGGYRDLTESTTYMWRDNSAYSRPNNLFTSASLLTQFNTDHEYTSSSITSVARLTPEQAAETAKANQANADAETTSKENNETVPLVEVIEVNFGRNANYNTVYTYDQATNSYLRSYANGDIHKSYTCSAGLNQPAPQRDCGEATQVSPKAVAVMEVQQTTASDGYHQNIATIGTGKAYVFQNGEAFEGSWTKNSINDQLEFHDTEGNLISFTPGQLWIAAIPASTGSVEY